MKLNRCAYRPWWHIISQTGESRFINWITYQVVDICAYMFDYIYSRDQDFKTPSNDRYPLYLPQVSRYSDKEKHFSSNLPSSLLYKTHPSRQYNCRSLRCSWSIACRRCSNYIFILDLTPGFIGLGEDNSTTRRETFKFDDSVRLILEILRYIDESWI